MNWIITTALIVICAFGVLLFVQVWSENICPSSSVNVSSYTILGNGTSSSLQSFWTTTLSATSFSEVFLVSDTYPVTPSSTVLQTFSNVVSGELYPVSFSDQEIQCKFFGVQVFAHIADCDPVASNLQSSDLKFLQGAVPPSTATLTFGPTNFTVSFPDGINVGRYAVYLYDVTLDEFALTQALLNNISVNLSPWVIPYEYLIPFSVTTPPLLQGNEYRLQIIVGNSIDYFCASQTTYSAVPFNQTFPSVSTTLFAQPISLQLLDRGEWK